MTARYAFQPGHRVGIEMVGRLVEQQHAPVFRSSSLCEHQPRRAGRTGKRVDTAGDAHPPPVRDPLDTPHDRALIPVSARILECLCHALVLVPISRSPFAAGSRRRRFHIALQSRACRASRSNALRKHAQAWCPIRSHRYPRPKPPAADTPRQPPGALCTARPPYPQPSSPQMMRSSVVLPAPLGPDDP